MTFTGVVAAVCVISGILLLRLISNLLPSLCACLLRWKECINLENSVKLSSDRDIFAAYLIIPFCLAASEYRLYDPALIHGLGPAAHFASVLAAFIIYLALRRACAIFVRVPDSGQKRAAAIRKTAFSFFCIMATLLLSAIGICSLTGTSAETTRAVSLYVSAAAYLIYLLRKFQIFRNSCSFFKAFLYLCASEILPTGTLALSAVFL